jgi:5-hydroxyisourate hydrolase-like protein (transthyretin family)
MKNKKVIMKKINEGGYNLVFFVNAFTNGEPHIISSFINDVHIELKIILGKNIHVNLIPFRVINGYSYTFL